MQRENTQRYEPGTVPDSDWRSDMVASMAIVVSEYIFTQGKYNEILVMLVDMDSEGVIETAELSSKKNHEKYWPTLTDAMAGEEAYKWLEATYTEISAL